MRSAWSVVGACAWATTILAGCSSSKDANPTAAPPDGGADGGGADAAADAAPALDATGVAPANDAGTIETTCLAPPFVTFTATLTTLDVSGATRPFTGGTVGFSTCPGFKVVPDATGKVSTQITQGIPLSPIYYAGATVGAVGAELTAGADVTLGPVVFALDVEPAIPGFLRDGGNEPTIVLALRAAGTTAPCNDASGATFTVTGHPEAIVRYGSAQWPSDPSVTTTPSGPGYVFINGLSGGKPSVTGTKTGCTVQVASSDQTGRFLLVPDAVTIGVATVTD